jgi:hypothetical protein
MMSNSSPDDRQNTHDNVFKGLHVGADESSLLSGYLAGHDFSDHTRKAIRNDLRKFARWFSESNRELFTVKRTTLRDVVDFRNHLHREQRQAVASINRALVSIRRFFDWLVRQGCIEMNPAKQVKELRRQPLAPKGLERADVRRLTVYVRDGRVPIDNNSVEQLMKQVAMGRKAWLFVCSVAGGEQSAKMMTLVSSARRHDLDVGVYIKDVLDQLLAGSTDYHSLLPDVWKQQHPEAVRAYRVEERRDKAERKQLNAARRRLAARNRR